MNTAAQGGEPPVLTEPLLRSPLREAISLSTRQPEPDLLPDLLDAARSPPEQARRIHQRALSLAHGLRQRHAEGSGRTGLVQGLLQEFALNSQEGVALMCLAEALLRIPDDATRDALIRDKISNGDWRAHLGQSGSMFVNAAAWGLLVTGKLVATHSDTGLSSALRRIVGRGGEPLIRRGVDLGMRMMGEQFVTGQTIAQALQHAATREPEGFRYSFDMLGEAAFTEADAQAYFQAYAQAIGAIGQASNGRGAIEGPGISIKLSALHPRYSRAQVARVKAEAYPRLLSLAKQARAQDIGLNIDAEEADRLELSLDLLEMLCFEPALAGWQGIGFVIQAYQKRCPAVIDHLADLARRSHHRLMVRLVKGAYWDSEIKRAQVDGLTDYPVYTRKAHTDVAYLACARKLLAAPDAFYPQFATHNAQTLAAVAEFAGLDAPPSAYEFQCLHGMGEPLYERVLRPVSEGGLGRPCRIYAPVGPHETLLAYLVRRLLENGANTSFVNRVANEGIALEELVRDPVLTVQASAAEEGRLGLPHPGIALPPALYGGQRRNCAGLDLASETVLAQLAARPPRNDLRAQPLLAGAAPTGTVAVAVRNPAQQGDVVGEVIEATGADVQAALAAAVAHAPAWAAQPAAQRATCLERAADALEARLPALLPLLVREAGKTHANAVAEVREAVDFLRYYAAQAREHLQGSATTPLGPVVCISPWNFPLAIFLGQVAAALAAGNGVLAKPAEQTPLIAFEAVRLLHAAGVPVAALQFLPGRGEVVGAALVADARTQGVLFTGSTEVARLLQRVLAQRLGAHGRSVPLVAETGGQNAMVVDSSALPEQVVADVLASAFDSAGQRCSALRLLCLQEEAAPRVLEMLVAAMRELRLGDPRALATDVGPVIDAEALAGIEAHVQALRDRGAKVWQPVPWSPALRAQGHFMPPTVIEIRSVSELTREVFGPVLHVLRYRREQLDELIQALNATGYGLTFGVHSRIDETVAQAASQVQAGNLYVNRNMVGAVVGVQPFGGEGLSGTGPKAGGPLALLRQLAHAPLALAAQVVRASGPMAPAPRGLRLRGAGPALGLLQAWARERDHQALVLLCEELAACNLVGTWHQLRGPTGENNLYGLQARAAVLCLAHTPADVLAQTAATVAVGARALWPGQHRALHDSLPAALRDEVALVADWQAPAVSFDAVLHHGSEAELLALQQQLAARPGPLVQVQGLRPGDTGFALQRLVNERSLSINTAAAGGNASLMTMG